MRVADAPRKAKAVLGVLAGALLLCCGVSLVIAAVDGNHPPKMTERSTPTAIPSATPVTVPSITPAVTRSSAPPVRSSSSAPRRSVYYANCAAARAAGAAPLSRTDPGYRRGLDRDGDGIACEK